VVINSKIRVSIKVPIYKPIFPQFATFLVYLTTYKKQISITMAENKNKTYEITPEGSLGLLALGAIGLRKWREVRDADKIKSKKDNLEDEQKNS
jgi:hypothetical protein